MKKTISLCALIATILVASIAQAAFYKLSNVKRVDSNIYSFTSGTVSGIVQTKYCYEYAYYDDAVLRYDKSSYENKLIFSSGEACDVADVYIK